MFSIQSAIDWSFLMKGQLERTCRAILAVSTRGIKCISIWSNWNNNWPVIGLEMWKFGSKIKNKKHKLYYSQRRMQNCFVKDQKMHCRCYALVIKQLVEIQLWKSLMQCMLWLMLFRKQTINLCCLNDIDSNVAENWLKTADSELFKVLENVCLCARLCRRSSC